MCIVTALSHSMPPAYRGANSWTVAVRFIITARTPLYFQKGYVHLWTTCPWRFAYITAADGAPRPGVPARLEAWPGDLGCVFCNLIASIDYAIANGMNREEAEASGGLILRGKHCFICLNAYPYTSGHVMVMPYAHLDRIAKLPTEAAHELMELAQDTERVIERTYHPHGFNFGLNLGQAAARGSPATCICTACRAGSATPIS